MTMDDLPYHFVQGIPYDTLYKRALDCYSMISVGLRDIIIEKYIGRMHDEDEELSPRAWDELCFVGFGIVLYHLVKDDKQFILSEPEPCDTEARKLFDKIVCHAFVTTWEAELDSYADETVKLPPKAMKRNVSMTMDSVIKQLLSHLSLESRRFLQSWFAMFD